MANGEARAGGGGRIIPVMEGGNGRRVGGSHGGVGLGGIKYKFLRTFTVRCLRKRGVTSQQ